MATVHMSAGMVAAQWQVPAHIVMDGSDEADRQVHGLADPQAPDAAISLDALHANFATYTMTTGEDTLTGSLSPAPSAYTPGMIVTIRPAAANHTGALLALNGLGAKPIVKWGGVPLDSADLPVNMPARLIYDGEHFLVLTNTHTPCPSGATLINRAYCIDDSTSSPASFFNAAINCASRGARLCTMSEWTNACRSLPWFLSTVTALEWADHASNNASDAKVLGTGWADWPAETTTAFSCRYGSTSTNTALRAYRCCITR